MLHKRKAKLIINQEIELGKAPLEVRGYNKQGEYVCRLLISHAGIRVLAGSQGNKEVVDLSWENFVKRLKTPEEP